MKTPKGSREIRIVPVPLDGEIVAGDLIAGKLLEAMRHRKVSFTIGDILIVKHKIVSKAEGQVVKLDSVQPSASSRRWARKYRLDARVTEVAISQSKRIVRRTGGF